MPPIFCSCCSWDLQIVEVEALALGDLLRQLLGFFHVDRTAHFLDQRDHIAHAQDAAGHSVRIEGFERIALLAHADEQQRAAGDLAHRRVRALLRRGQSSTTQFAGLTWSSDTRQAWAGAADLNLTRSEAALLEALLHSRGRILSKGSLAQRLGADESGASDNSVEVYIYRLRRKLAPAGAGIRTVRGLGYVLEALA